MKNFVDKIKKFFKTLSYPFSHIEKWGKRAFALTMSVLFLCLAGCSFAEEDEISAMAGAKVLSKTDSYSLTEAMDGYTTNFFNLFSKNVLELLYKVYENPTSLTDDEKSALYASSVTLLDGTTSELSSDDIYTYDDLLAGTSGSEYLYDSLRYTITTITTTNSVDSVKFDKSTAWNWTIAYDSTYAPTVFKNAGLTLDVTQDTVTVSLSDTVYSTFMTMVTAYLPSFGDVYYSDSSEENASGNIDYYESPYYSASTSLNNYYQDLFEYVTYLTVLGCDPDDADYADYYDFTISTSTTGVVSEITVGGWSTGKISLSGTNGALEQVKEVYESIGKYVGLTAEDRSKIVDFILETVIGSSATSADTFTVSTSVDGAAATEATFSRNYEQMVSRIVDYACQQVAIGEDDAGELTTLDDPFPIAQITDYYGNYFFTNEDIETGDGTFDYIDAQEFQSLVIFPNASDVNAGYPIGVIGILFEYAGDDSENYGESLTVNVGVRFYSHSTNTLSDAGSAEVVIQAGACETLDADDYLYLITTDEDFSLVPIDEYTYSSTVLADGRIEGCFNTSIGSDSINAFKNGTIRAGTANSIATMTVKGSGAAKSYYKTNKSSSYGTYSTLNEEMFAGDDGCDFFEIYFDIEKTGSSLSEIAATNHNFKVAFCWFSFDEVL